MQINGISIANILRIQQIYAIDAKRTQLSTKKLYCKRTIQQLIEMVQPRTNYLTVDFDMNKGLKFQWNFQDLKSKEKYFRHIFVICHTNHEAAIQTIETFYKKMKFGDLIAIIFPDKITYFKVSRWIEKSQLSVFSTKKLLKNMSTSYLDKVSKSKLIQLAAKESKYYNEPTVVNFLLGDDFDDDFFKKKIQEARIQDSFPYIVSLFGNFSTNLISVTQGVNIFSLNQSSMMQSISFYLGFLGHAALHSAKINITCHNGQITSNDQNQWKNINFCQLERKFYGPSVNYTGDQIFFFQYQNTLEVFYDITVFLQINLFSHKKFLSTKRFQVNSPIEKLYQQTFNCSHENIYNSDSGLLFDKNPYKSYTSVRFLKNIAEDKDQI